MRADEYRAFADRSRLGYIDGMVEHGGMLRSAAEAKADRDFALVLPDGLETPGHWIFVVEADGLAVGVLWFAERVMDGRTTAFLYDIHIDADQQGRGHGRAALLAFEQEASRARPHASVAERIRRQRARPRAVPLAGIRRDVGADEQAALTPRGLGVWL
jgi:ribosomal protein S18 acetylase RimI-like enzyme